MKVGLLWNFITSPRSTIIGIIGSCSAGAALLLILNAMGCDLSKLTLDVLSEAAALIAAPTVAGGVMRDEKRTAGDDAHAHDGGNAV